MGSDPSTSAAARDDGVGRAVRRASARRGWLAPAVVAVVTLAAFAPALTGDFLTWDDFYKLRYNPRYRGLGWAELRWMWTTTHTGLYQPIAWMTWGADYLLWGTNPVGYHLSSVLYHALTAVLAYRLARRLFELASRDAASGEAASDARVEGRLRATELGAGLAALVFAAHPLRAEPVAWISARGDVLAGLFAIAATLAYLDACGSPARRGADPRRLMLSVGLFALALLSKATALALPATLVVLDVYPLRRLGGGGTGQWLGSAARRVWAEKLPFVAVALAVVFPTVLAKARTSSMLPPDAFDPLAALARTAYGVVFYLRTSLWPVAISPLYERPPHLDPVAWPFVASEVVVAVITGALVLGRRQWPAGLAAWIAYLVLLIPTAGLVPYGSQLVAARYTYLPCLGWAILAGSALPVLQRSWSDGRLRRGVWLTALGIAAASSVTLAVLTWQQTWIWRDSETLWTYTLRVTPRSALARIELGLLAERRGDPALADAYFREALAIWPGAQLDDLAMARMFELEGRPGAAALHYRRARAQGRDSRALGLALGRALADAGDLSGAAAELGETVRRFPDFADGHVMLGIVLAAQGQREAAVAALRTALRLDPDSALGHYYLGLALARDGARAEAAEHYRRALALRPDLDAARRALDAVVDPPDSSTAHGQP